MNTLAKYYNIKKARKVLKIIKNKHIDYFNKHGFLSFGTALTIWRDGITDDDDIDFFFNEEFFNDYENKIKYLTKLGFKIIREFYVDNKIQEVTMKFKGVNVDLFRHKNGEIYSFKNWKLEGGCEEVFIHLHKKDLLIKKINSINTIADPKFFQEIYGKNYNVKITSNKKYRAFQRKDPRWIDDKKITDTVMYIGKTNKDIKKTWQTQWGKNIDRDKKEWLTLKAKSLSKLFYWQWKILPSLYRLFHKIKYAK